MADLSVSVTATTTAPSSQGFLLALTSVVIWGFNVVALKAILGVLPVVPTNVARILTMCACFALTMLLLHLRPRLNWQLVLALFAVGCLSTSGYQFLFAGGVQNLPAGVASLVGATNPVWVAVFGVLLGERLTARRWFGIALSVLGVVLLSLKTLEPGSNVNLMGIVMILGSSFAWAIYSVSSRQFRTLSSVEFTSISVLLGGIPYLLFGFSAFTDHVTQPVPWYIWLGVIGSAVMSNFVAFLTWSGGVRSIGATRAASLLNITPIISVAVASAVLREPLSWLLVVSALVTLSGVYLANSASR